MVVRILTCKAKCSQRELYNVATNDKVEDVDLGYKEFKKFVLGLKATGPDVLVGLIGSDAEAEHEKAPDFTVAAIGAIHEFGVDEPPVKIPQRSWLRAPFDENRKKYEALLARLTRQMILGGKGMTMEQALGIVGLAAEEDIRKAIRAKIPPPLKTATIRAKGSDVPLLDTGQLIQSITHLVVPNAEKIAL